MSDLHDRFGEWLTDGARADLPRDAALHASACDACLRDAASFDALLAIDPGAAILPPVRTSLPAREVPSIGLLRAGIGVAAILLLAISVGIGAGGLLERRTELGAATPTSTAEGEGILGGAGGPASTFPGEPVGTSTADPSASGESDSPEASDAQFAPTPATGFATPAPVVTPRPSTITPPLGTPRPSASGAATPVPTAVASVPPSATAAPTPVPTAIPTPTPSPPPGPPQCSDGLDNDDDGLIDFGLDPLVNDPGCLSADDDDESDL